MPGLVTDTHALVRYLLNSPRMSAPALERIRATLAAGDAILVPAICLVEFLYLTEKGRLPKIAIDRLSAHLDEPDSGLIVVPLDRGVAQSVGRVPRSQVPDMPDRIIAATALHLNLPLLSRDGAIRSAGIETVW